MDILIVGAGVAGLAALQRLAAAGHRPVVLEARDRVGGRVFTHQMQGRLPIELGAEWLDGEGIVRHLLEAHELPLKEAQGSRWIRDHGELVRAREPYDRELIKRLRRVKGRDRPLTQALRHCCQGMERDRMIEPLLRYVEGFHAADPERVSFHWFMEVEGSQSALQSVHRAPLGVDGVLRALQVPGAEIRLETMVREIRWRRGRVRVTTETNGSRESWEAEKVVVTVPLSLLKASRLPTRIRFSPALTSRQVALERLEMGGVHKMVFAFDRPFWEEIDRFRDLLMLHALDRPFPTWWTLRPTRGSYLTGWVGGPGSRRVDRVPPEGRVELALDSLACGLGLPRRDVEARLVGWFHHDWQADPWSRGAYSFIRPGGIAAWRTIARPLKNAVFFAGEATAAHGYNATIEGAIATGWRAAQEILK